MKPTATSRNNDLRLFEPPDYAIKSMAETRNLAGEFFELATENLTGGRRLRTDSRCFCPDLQISPTLFIECKSVGTSCRTLIYERIFEKQKRFVHEAGSLLHFYFWHHLYRCSDAKDTRELRSGLADRFDVLSILDFSSVETLLKGRATTMLNKKHREHKGANRFGFGTPDYRTGWNLELKYFLEKCTFHGRLPGNVLVRDVKIITPKIVMTPEAFDEQWANRACGHS